MDFFQVLDCVPPNFNTSTSIRVCHYKMKLFLQMFLFLKVTKEELSNTDCQFSCLQSHGWGFINILRLTDRLYVSCVTMLTSNLMFAPSLRVRWRNCSHKRHCLNHWLRLGLSESMYELSCNCLFFWCAGLIVAYFCYQQHYPSLFDDEGTIHPLRTHFLNFLYTMWYVYQELTVYLSWYWMCSWESTALLGV